MWCYGPCLVMATRTSRKASKLDITIHTDIWFNPPCEAENNGEGWYWEVSGVAGDYQPPPSVGSAQKGGGGWQGVSGVLVPSLALRDLQSVRSAYRGLWSVQCSVGMLYITRVGIGIETRLREVQLCIPRPEWQVILAMAFHSGIFSGIGNQARVEVKYSHQ